ncbi:hypothetical protein F5880DRAFT_1731257 [Lentinula raphanica]|nr:hypothetical protein F5880DRAFT_1731257 [Lentinula raphanica]
MIGSAERRPGKSLIASEAKQVISCQFSNLLQLGRNREHDVYVYLLEYQISLVSTGIKLREHITVLRAHQPPRRQLVQMYLRHWIHYHYNGNKNRSPTSSLHQVLLTAPRAVLTKRQHAIQFDQPTFSRPESFDGLNLGHANESCHAARKEGWGFPEGFEVVMGSEKNNNGREDPPTIRFGVHLEDTDSPTMRDLGWGEIRIRRKNFPDYEFTMSSNIKTNAKVTIGKESDSMMFKESGNGVVVVVGRELKKSANEKKKKSDKCCVM